MEGGILNMWKHSSLENLLQVDIMGRHSSNFTNLCSILWLGLRIVQIEQRSFTPKSILSVLIYEPIYPEGDVKSPVWVHNPAKWH